MKVRKRAISTYVSKGIRNKIKARLERIERYRKMKTIHCEAIHDDRVWGSIQEVIRNERFLFFCVTPVNYKYVDVVFGIDLGHEDYSELLVRRYKFLEERGQRIELHVHLALLLHRLSYQKQESMIMGAYEWMVERGFKPAMFVPGWWSYNEDTVKIIKKLGLKLILYKDYLYLHDYQLMDYLKGKIDFT